MPKFDPTKLVLDPEVRAIIDLDPGNIIGCLRTHVAAAARHFATGLRTPFGTRCDWHGAPVFITTTVKGFTRTTRVSFKP